jgi:hypothetical protein
VEGIFGSVSLRAEIVLGRARPDPDQAKGTEICRHLRERPHVGEGAESLLVGVATSCGDDGQGGRHVALRQGGLERRPPRLEQGVDDLRVDHVHDDRRRMCLTGRIDDSQVR